MANVLNVGFDNALLTTRSMMLERANHAVTDASDLRQVIAACEATRFDIAILGNSLNANEKMRVADVVRKSCIGAKILELHNGRSPDVPNADAHLRALDAIPQELVQAVETLSKQKRAAATD